MRIANYCGNMEAKGDTALNLKELDSKMCYQWPLALVLIKTELCKLRGEVEAKINLRRSKMGRVFDCLVGQSF
jgi:hypothetical protein